MDTPLLFTFLLLSVSSAAAKQSLRQLGNKNGHPNVKHSHRCKDNFDAADWIATTGGKDGEDTCQPCCVCDCHDSASGDNPWVAPTAAETCDVLRDNDKSSSSFVDYTCADAGHLDPVGGGCTDQAVIDACDAICYPSDAPSISPAPMPV